MNRHLVSALAGALVLTSVRLASACPGCEAGRIARAELLDPAVLTPLAIITTPFVLFAVFLGFTWRRAPLVTAGVALGMGIGGFFDGIVFHQLLQWHSMFSSLRPPLDVPTIKLNMLGDGIFHSMTWLATAAGLALLWRAVTRPEAVLSTRVLVAALAVGWGVFNLIEGIVDHQVLGIHHVHPGADEAAWDIGFLASGALLIAAGYFLVRRDQRDPSARRFTTHVRAPG